MPVAFSAARKAVNVPRPAGSAVYQLRVFLMLLPKSARPTVMAGPIACRIRMKASAVSRSCGRRSSGSRARARKPRKTGSRIGRPATSSGPSCLQSRSLQVPGRALRTRSSRATAEHSSELLPSSCPTFGSGRTARTNAKSASAQQGPHQTSNKLRSRLSVGSATSTHASTRRAILRKAQASSREASREAHRASRALGTRTMSSTGSLQAPGFPEEAWTRQTLPAPRATRCVACVEPASKAKVRRLTPSSPSACAAPVRLSWPAGVQALTRRSSTATWTAGSPAHGDCSSSRRTSTSISPVEPRGRTLRPANASLG
mmetsp:Transcript_139578/g.434172  ORF Transcript_139578/g.434172 Transcript_139578/m.434172 type:complete len:316 (+) Transcript_139578:470-1417(+)